MGIFTLCALYSSRAQAAVLKRMFSGQTTIAAAATTRTITLPATIDLTKSFLVFTMSFNEADPTYAAVSGQLTSTTAVFRRNDQNATVVNIQYYVVEFFCGVKVQRGATNIPDTTMQVDVPITTIDRTKAIPLFGIRAPGPNFSRNDWAQVTFTSNTNMRITLDAVPQGTATMEWQVIEFQDATVRTGTVNFTATQNSQTATLSPAIANLNKAWLVWNHKIGDPHNLDRIGEKMIRGTITNTTTLTFDRDATGTVPAPTTINLTYYLVEFLDDTVTQQGIINMTTAQLSNTATITAVDLTKSIVLGGHMMREGRTSAVGTDNGGSGWMMLDFTSATQVRATRGTTLSSTSSMGFSVVEFLSTSPVCFDTAVNSSIAPGLRPGVAVFAGNANGDIFAFDSNPANATYGNLLWTYAEPVGAIDKRFGISAATSTVFVSSMDGCFYSVNSATGARRAWSGAGTFAGGSIPCSSNTNERLADTLAAAPVRHGPLNTVFVGTRNTSGNPWTEVENKVWALNSTTLACNWVFNGTCAGADGTTRVGMISNSPTLDIPGNCMYFTTQETLATDHTVFAVRTNTNGCNSVGAAGSLAWSITTVGATNLGSIDASPALSEDRCTLYVGTNAGAIYALRTGGAGCTGGAAGTAKWTTPYSTGTAGAFVETIWAQNSRLYFSQGNTVRRVDDLGTSATQRWSQAITGPAMPLVISDFNRLWVGSSDGKLHQLCADTATTPCVGSQIDVQSNVQSSSAAVVSSPTLDVTTCSGSPQTCTVFIGVDTGRIYGKRVPY